MFKKNYAPTARGFKEVILRVSTCLLWGLLAIDANGQASTVVVNEWLANTEPPLSKYVELYNSGPGLVSLSGYFLSDDLDDRTKYRIPDGTIIAAGGFMFFEETHLGFFPPAAGGRIGLFSPGGAPVDVVTFGQQADAVSQGRWPDGSANVYSMLRTPGARNLLATSEVDCPFSLSGPDSVFFKLFNVVAPGTVQIEVNWQGGQNLTVALTGRRRPSLPDPASPYAAATGPSPVLLSYNVTEDDLNRGVAWRLIVRDPAQGTASGEVRISHPFDQTRYAAFLKERVSLRSGDLWPSAILDQQLLDGLAVTPKTGLHGIITLRRAMACAEMEDLEKLGLFLQSHLARPSRHAFGLLRKDFDLGDPRVALLVRNVTPLDPEDKIAPDILVGNYGRFVVTPPQQTARHYVLNGDGTLQLSILFARDIPATEIRTILAAETAAFLPMSLHLWRCAVDRPKVIRLAAYDEVEWIEPGSLPFLPRNDRTRQVLNVDAVQGATIDSMAGTITFAGLTGAGVTVSVHDSGIDASHPDLTVVADSIGAAVHGTHVAGIIAGNGRQSSASDAIGNPNGGTSFQFRGMAPNARLIDALTLEPIESAPELYNAIVNHSLDVVNHSHALNNDPHYDAAMQMLDEGIRGDAAVSAVLADFFNIATVRIPRRPQVFAAANNGGSAQYGQLVDYFAVSEQFKNVIMVGNWNAFGPGLSSGSGMGPAHDGRIKPDVVAPGEGVKSTALQNGYLRQSGTSMASPAVAGVLALLLEGWQNTYSTPLGTTIDRTPPFPSTLKAVLIQTATDIVANRVRGTSTSTDVDFDSVRNNGNDGMGFPTATVGPDFATGWGLVNATGAVALLQDARIFYGRPVPNRIVQDVIDQGSAKEYGFVVTQSGPLKVTLAWDDFAGAVQSPATNSMLVNDLDLELIAPDGMTVYLPWQLGHTNVDEDGKVLLDNQQPPGTTINVILPITPSPLFSAAEYIPSNALAATGSWAARPGRDHLNNVEQVFIPNVQSNQFGHWKARVVGFDVRTGRQDFSLVGFPYPPLAELAVWSAKKITLTELNDPRDITWAVTNQGTVGTDSSFDYKVWLSRDFFVDQGDQLLVDAHQVMLGPLAAGAWLEHTSSVRITQTDANAVMGNPGGNVTLDQLLDADVFLLVQVDAANVVPEHNEENVTFLQAARQADIVLVLDRSRSMSEVVPVSSGSRTKMDLLKDAGNMFLDLMRLDAGDQVAKVTFSDDATIDLPLTPITSANVGQYKQAVDNMAPTSTTDIQAGLQFGLDALGANPLMDQRRVMILLSDGMRTPGTGDPTTSTFLDQFTTQKVNVYSVGFGTDIDRELLTKLSEANGARGFFHVTESAAGLDKFFVNAVAGAIRSEVLVDPESDVQPGQSRELGLAVCQKDFEAKLVLTWDNPAFNLELAARSPSGLEINAANAALFPDTVKHVSPPNLPYRILQMKFPVSTGPSGEHGGTWQMVVRNPGNVPVHYAAAIIAESTLRANVQQPRSMRGGSFNPHEPATFTLNLTDQGRPVDGASVIVTPNVPLVSLGTLLAGAGINQAELAQIPTHLNGDVLSLRERMYRALLRRMNARSLLPRGNRPGFAMTAQAAGTYTGTFADTGIDGVYDFLVRVEGHCPMPGSCDRFQREISRSISVGSVAVPTGPGVTVTQVPAAPGAITLTITPHLGNGQYLGPGFSSLIVINATGQVQVASAVMDNLDGTYLQTFHILNPGLATFHIRVGDVDLDQITLDTSLAAPIAVYPAGGRNDVSTPIAVTLASGSGTSNIVAVTLVSADLFLPLGAFAEGTNVYAEVPSWLPPAVYRIRLESFDGQSSAFGEATFRVVGRGQNFPAAVDLLASTLQGLGVAGSQAEGFERLGLLLRDLQTLPLGYNFTQEARSLAYTRVLELLKRGNGQVTPAELAPIRSAVNAAKVDARAVPVRPVWTPAGTDVLVELGNGVSVFFGHVIAPGETTLRLMHGPPEVLDANRGSPHITYEITTTAAFAPSVYVEVAYEDGDFEQEERLRLFHREGEGWMDRTEVLYSQGNLILGRAADLGQFVIVQRRLEPPQLSVLGWGPTGHLHLELQGEPGAYEVQHSSDLRFWETMGPINLGFGSAEIIDQTSNRTGSRFYRAVLMD